MTPGEMETVVLLLLVALFLAALVYTMVLVFFRPWLIMRRDQDEAQNLKTAAAELLRSRPEMVSEDDGRAEGREGEGGPSRRPSWRRMFGG